MPVGKDDNLRIETAQKVTRRMGSLLRGGDCGEGTMLLSIQGSEGVHEIAGKRNGPWE